MCRTEIIADSRIRHPIVKMAREIPTLAFLEIHTHLGMLVTDARHHRNRIKVTGIAQIAGIDVLVLIHVDIVRIVCRDIPGQVRHISVRPTEIMTQYHLGTGIQRMLPRSERIGIIHLHGMLPGNVVVVIDGPGQQYGVVLYPMRLSVEIEQIIAEIELVSDQQTMGIVRTEHMTVRGIRRGAEGVEFATRIHTVCPLQHAGLVKKTRLR